MLIEGEDYRLSNDGESVHWDLGKPEREEFGDPLYGMPLERAIKIIINHRLSRKKEVYTLQEYLNSYKDEINKLKEILDHYEI